MRSLFEFMVEDHDDRPGKGYCTGARSIGFKQHLFRNWPIGSIQPSERLALVERREGYRAGVFVYPAGCDVSKRPVFRKYYLHSSGNEQVAPLLPEGVAPLQVGERQSVQGASDHDLTGSGHSDVGGWRRTLRVTSSRIDRTVTVEDDLTAELAFLRLFDLAGVNSSIRVCFTTGQGGNTLRPEFSLDHFCEVLGLELESTDPEESTHQGVSTQKEGSPETQGTRLKDPSPFLDSDSIDHKIPLQNQKLVCSWFSRLQLSYEEYSHRRHYWWFQFGVPWSCFQENEIVMGLLSQWATELQAAESSDYRAVAFNGIVDVFSSYWALTSGVRSGGDEEMSRVIADVNQLVSGDPITVVSRFSSFSHWIVEHGSLEDRAIDQVDDFFAFAGSLLFSRLGSGREE